MGPGGMRKRTARAAHQAGGEAAQPLRVHAYPGRSPVSRIGGMGASWAWLRSGAGAERHGPGGSAVQRAGPWSEGRAGGQERQVTGTDVPAATAGAWTQAISVVQLDEAPKQTLRRGRGNGGGALCGTMGRASGVGAGASAVLGRQGGRREAVRDAEAAAGGRGPREEQTRDGSDGGRGTAPVHPTRLKRSPRPLGHASTCHALHQLGGQYRAFVLAFREAAAHWLRGDCLARLPSSRSLRVLRRIASLESSDTLRGHPSRALRLSALGRICDHS